jgi:hypothetical protein
VQQAVAAADPETAHLIRENNALRNKLNEKLQELTGADAAELKKRYGALSTIQSEVVPRKNVIARQNPVNLAEQISYGRGMANIAKSAANMQFGDALSGAADLATTKLLKLRNDPNELIKLAFSKLEKNPRAPYAQIQIRPPQPQIIPEAVQNQFKSPLQQLLPSPNQLQLPAPRFIPQNAPAIRIPPKGANNKFTKVR